MSERKVPRPLRLVGRALRRIHGIGAMSVGRVRSARPLSQNWGYDRGTPIDRYYIEGFLAECAADVRGHVLEVQEDDYSRRFGGTRVTGQDILNIDASDPRTTLSGDLANPATLPSDRFDCVILTQTLHLVFDMPAAIANVHRSLRPGGVALITVPGITPVAPDPNYNWYWSLTEQALRKLLGQSFEQDEVTSATFGNLFAATAFLHAAAVEEVGRSRLKPCDASFPVTVTARAVRKA